MQKKLIVVFLCGLMAMLAGALQAANVGSTSVKAGWCDAARWVGGVVPTANDGNEYWATNNFQSSVASVAFPCTLHIGASAGSVLGNAENLTPTIQIQVKKIGWEFTDLIWHGGTIRENTAADSTKNVNIIAGNARLEGSQDRLLAVMSKSNSGYGQTLQFNVTLTGSQETVLALGRTNGDYTYSTGGAVGIIKMGGDSSQFNGSFATAGTAYYDTIFFTTDNPLGNPATPNAAALVLKEKAVLAFANGIKQSANRGIRIDGNDVYLMAWEGKNDDWSIESPITKGEGVAAKVCKDGPGTVTLDCSYSAGDIAVNAGTLVLASGSTFPSGQKLKVEAGAKVISYRSLAGFEITGEGSVERQMVPMEIPYDGTKTTPIQLGSDFDIEQGLVQPMVLSSSIALPFHEVKELVLAKIAAGARDFVATEFSDVTAKTYGLPHTTVRVVKDEESGVQQVVLVAKPVVKSKDGLENYYLTEGNMWSNDDVPNRGFDYLVTSNCRQQPGNIREASEFAGDSLTLAARLQNKTTPYTVSDLRIPGGFGVQMAISSSVIRGCLTVDASSTDENPAYVMVSKDNSATLNCEVRGTGTLKLTSTVSSHSAGTVRLNGDNSQFFGNMLLAGDLTATVANLTVDVSCAEALGGAGETAKTDAIQASGGVIVHPTATMTLDTGKRGWTVSSGSLLVDGGNVFTLKEALTLDGTLTKTGAGALALGGAASGAGTLLVRGGALQPLTADCCAPFSIEMAEGTALVLDLANEALREGGLQAAKLLPSCESDSFSVRIENAVSAAAGRDEFEVVLCTLPADTADVSGSMVVTAKGYKCKSVTRVAVPDSDLVRYTVTLWKSGCALILR